MNIKKRKPKPNDEEVVDEAVVILLNLMRSNKQIDPTLWVTAFSHVTAHSYKQSGFPFHRYKDDIFLLIDHYENLWYD